MLDLTNPENDIVVRLLREINQTAAAERYIEIVFHQHKGISLNPAIQALILSWRDKIHKQQNANPGFFLDDTVLLKQLAKENQLYSIASQDIFKSEPYEFIDSPEEMIAPTSRKKTCTLL